MASDVESDAGTLRALLRTCITKSNPKCEPNQTQIEPKSNPERNLRRKTRNKGEVAGQPVTSVDGSWGLTVTYCFWYLRQVYILRRCLVFLRE